MGQLHRSTESQFPVKSSNHQNVILLWRLSQRVSHQQSGSIRNANGREAARIHSVATAKRKSEKGRKVPRSGQGGQLLRLETSKHRPQAFREQQARRATKSTTFTQGESAVQETDGRSDHSNHQTQSRFTFSIKGPLRPQTFVATFAVLLFICHSITRYLYQSPHPHSLRIVLLIHPSNQSYSHTYIHTSFGRISSSHPFQVITSSNSIH